MSTTFEPREVEKPFAMRWLRMTLQLMLRSPIRFSIAILLLGCLDAFVLHLLPRAIPWPWTRRIGMFLLPLSWVVIAAIARGADNPSQKWKALTSLARPSVWVAALAIGLGLITLDLVIHQLLFAGVDLRDEKLLPGRVLEFTAAQAWMVTCAAGICFFPLLVLEPGLSFQEIQHLSQSATDINGRWPISWFVTGVLCAALFLEQHVPGYGMTMAACIVFMGVLNFVAYRDIFERRSADLPEEAVAVSAAPAHATE